MLLGPVDSIVLLRLMWPRIRAASPILLRTLLITSQEAIKADRRFELYRRLDRLLGLVTMVLILGARESPVPNAVRMQPSMEV